MSLQWRHNECDDVSNNVSIVRPTVCSCTYQRKYQSSRHWPLSGESTSDRWFPSQRASNAEILSFDDVIIYNLELDQYRGDDASPHYDMFTGNHENGHITDPLWGDHNVGCWWLGTAKNQAKTSHSFDHTVTAWEHISWLRFLILFQYN